MLKKLLLLTCLWLAACSSSAAPTPPPTPTLDASLPPAEPAAQEFLAAWERADYSTMYSLVSNETQAEPLAGSVCQSLYGGAIHGHGALCARAVAIGAAGGRAPARQLSRRMGHGVVRHTAVRLRADHVPARRPVARELGRRPGVARSEKWRPISNPVSNSAPRQHLRSRQARAWRSMARSSPSAWCRVRCRTKPRCWPASARS